MFLVHKLFWAVLKLKWFLKTVINYKDLLLQSFRRKNSLSPLSVVQILNFLLHQSYH